ncbi:TPA: hypothetical protein ACUME3_001944 [Haemophilus influenzae]
MELRTNKEVTKEAFYLCFRDYFADKDLDDVTAELKLILENSYTRYYDNFMNSRRIKAHSAAFYSVYLALKDYMPTGYYASNAQIKANILEFFKMDYKAFLKPLIKRLEELREENLHYKKGKKK